MRDVDMVLITPVWAEDWVCGWVWGWGFRVEG